MASRDAAESPRSAPRRSNAAAAAPKDGGAGVLRPTFRSAAELAGWDEESILLAALVVEDTPVRESRLKRRFSTSAGSAGSNTRCSFPFDSAGLIPLSRFLGEFLDPPLDSTFLQEEEVSEGYFSRDAAGGPRARRRRQA
jgi:hypothetical protein